MAMTAAADRTARGRGVEDIEMGGGGGAPHSRDVEMEAAGGAYERWDGRIAGRGGAGTNMGDSEKAACMVPILEAYVRRDREERKLGKAAKGTSKPP